MSSLSIKSILEKHVLTGANFLDWIRNVRLVLRQEKVEYVLDTAIPVKPTDATALATLMRLPTKSMLMTLLMFRQSCSLL